MNELRPSYGLDLVSAIEREQRQIGFELHDNICQTLAGTSMLLETIGRAVTAGKPVSADDFRSLGKILETAIDQTRSLSQRYRPVNLEGAGLMQALQELANDSAHCVFQCEKAVFVPGKDQALALYRVAQEAVKNAVQHSGARKIRILLYHLDSIVMLKVKDNGVGFGTETGEFGSGGISIMRWRATGAGGDLQVRSRAGIGTTVVFRLPVA